MKPIHIFYHFYIPADMRAVSWNWCLDEQLNLIEKSGILKFAKIKMCITMPMAWWDILDVPLTKHLQPEVKISFCEKVQEYIHERYPFVQIISIRDTGAQNIYEGATLHEVYKSSQKYDSNVLYIHNKGTVVSNSPSVGCWRQVLNHFCITEWEKRIQELETYDVLGVADKNGIDKVMSGNFWWSKSSYIKNLPAPLNSSYLPDPNLHMFAPHYRYAFERWIMIGEAAKIHYVFDTKTDHYLNYFFMDNI